MVDYTYSNIYKDKTVLVTGHTGFKGSWLCAWLKELGANVIGYSLVPPTSPNHFELLDLDITSIIGNILDKDKLNEVFEKYKPKIVFHLAAQPLVRYSYDNPVETYDTNIMGMINVFEACRKTSSVKVIINITSDKCYENKEQEMGYKETDSMGGFDPYSTSKGCAELITACYRNSYFKDNGILLASCRAGNVIGGGDWAEDRLIPDTIKAVSQNKKVKIRRPNSTRPWQHVLEPLSGYLLVGQRLLNGDESCARGWNFGPKDNCAIEVKEVVEYIKKFWDKIDYEIIEDNSLHEAGLLQLDCSMAKKKLNWEAKYTVEETFYKVVYWYKEFYENKNIITNKQLKEYIGIDNG